MIRPEFVRLLYIQCIVLVIAAFVTYKVADLSAAKSIIYGNLIVLISALFLTWRHGQQQHAKAEWVLRQAYKTVIERFAVTILLLLIGLKLLELSPLWLIAGFVMGQAAWLLAPIWIRLRTQNDK